MATIFLNFNLFLDILRKNVLKLDHGKVANFLNFKMASMTIEIYTIFCLFCFTAKKGVIVMSRIWQCMARRRHFNILISRFDYFI